MLKEKKSLFLFVFMALLLVTNWLTWSNTKDLQQKINRLQGELYNLRSHVSSEVSGIRGVVQEIKNDARWWTPAEVEFLDVDREKVLVKVNWHLREYRNGSTVMLNYLPPEKEEYLQVTAEEESKGRFSVVLPVKVSLEPVLDVHVERVGRNKNERAGIAINEARAADRPDLSLRYYISVQDGEIIRTSEKRSLDLSKLNFELFNPLNLRVRLVSNGQIIASAHQHKVGNPRYEIKEIYLETRKGKDKVLEKWPLQPAKVPEEDQDRLKIYNVQATPSQDYDSLHVVIKYSDGVMVEREISRV